MMNPQLHKLSISTRTGLLLQQSLDPLSGNQRNNIEEIENGRLNIIKQQWYQSYHSPCVLLGVPAIHQQPVPKSLQSKRIMPNKRWFKYSKVDIKYSRNIQEITETLSSSNICSKKHGQSKSMISGVNELSKLTWCTRSNSEEHSKHYSEIHPSNGIKLSHHTIFHCHGPFWNWYHGQRSRFRTTNM
jgi:hypothetical protein